jgi:hypothetical protein
MHILLTTYGLLMIMALFAMAQWKNAETMIFTDAVASSHFQKTQEELLDKLKTKTSDTYRKASPKQKTSSKQDQKEEIEDIEEDEDSLFLPDDSDPAEGTEVERKGKRSHLLSVAPLFCDKNASRVEGKGKACFQLLKNLMDTLYSKQEFYTDYQKANPNLHEDLIIALIDKAKEASEQGVKLTRAKKLTKLKLDDEIFREIRRKEFTGNKSVNDKQLSTLGYYPLYEFLTIHKTPHLASLWLAPKALLYAIFQDDEAVSKICQLRIDLFNEQKRERKGSKENTKTMEDLHKQKIEQFFRSYPSEFTDSQFFDFATSKTRPPNY